jgi:hypothetical protein
MNVYVFTVPKVIRVFNFQDELIMFSKFDT